MVKHHNFHPEICKLLDELEELKSSANSRANDLMRNEENREYSRGTVDAYAFCQLRLRELNL